MPIRLLSFRKGTVVPEQLRQQRLTSTQAAKDLRSLCEGRNVAIKTVRMSSLRSICELQKRLRAKGDEVRCLRAWPLDSAAAGGATLRVPDGDGAQVYVIDTYRDPRAVVANLLDSGHEALSSIPTAQKVKKLSESVRGTAPRCARPGLRWRLCDQHLSLLHLSLHGVWASCAVGLPAHDGPLQGGP